MSNRLLTILGAAGVTAGLGLASVDDLAAKAKGFERDTTEALETFLQERPTNERAPDAFRQLASRFKAPGDKGRPDIFGEPGRPDIGPPGQYEG